MVGCPQGNYKRKYLVAQNFWYCVCLSFTAWVFCQRVYVYVCASQEMVIGSKEIAGTSKKV